MKASLWNRPVTIELDGVVTQSIRNTREAAWYLLEDWTAERNSMLYVRAVTACMKAMGGALPDAAARISFLAAARDAGVPVALKADIREYDPFVAELAEAMHEEMFAISRP